MLIMATNSTKPTRDKERRNMSQSRGRCKKSTLKKAHKLGKFPEVDVFLMLRINGQYITYNSTQQEPPSVKEIVGYQCL
jgi:hypothetical protein